jgi:hypothetical protein
MLYWILYLVPMVLLLLTARGLTRGKYDSHNVFQDEKVKEEFTRSFGREATKTEMTKVLALGISTIAFIPIFNLILVILGIVFKK